MGQRKQHFIYVQSTWFQELHHVYTCPTPNPIPQKVYFLVLDLSELEAILLFVSHSGPTFLSVYILVEELIFFLNFPILSLGCKSRIFLHTSWHISNEKHAVLISSPSTAEACLKPIYC